MEPDALELFYEKLLSDLKGVDHIFTATVEVPRGQLKPYWDKPCFADYGYIEGYINPADGDPVDIYLVNYVIRLQPKETIRTRILGVLKNRDGDIKLLGVPPQNFKISSEDIDALIKRENVYNPGTKVELFQN